MSGRRHADDVVDVAVPDAAWWREAHALDRRGPVPLEDRMGLHYGHYEQIARSAAVVALIAHSRNAHGVPAFYAGGQGRLDFVHSPRLPRPVARPAGMRRP